MIRAACLILLAALVLAPPALPAADNPLIVFRVYEGPIDDPSKKFAYKDVELKAGSKEAEEFVANYGKSNPGLVKAYKKLTEDQKLGGFIGDLMALTGKPKKLILADDSRKYVDRDKDGKPDTDEAAKDVTHVWPHSAGSYVVISKSYLDTHNSDEQLTSVVIHELSHTQDASNRDRGDYGPDDNHYADEILYNQTLKKHAETAAWIEGWANFTPMLFDPGERKDAVRAATTLRREGEKGKYTDVPWKDASYDDLISVEYINSLILYDIARLLPGGQDGLLAAFKATASHDRLLRDVLREYIRKHPSQAFAVAAIFDAYTGFKAPKSVLEDILGEKDAGTYSKELRAGLKAKNTRNSLAGAEDVTRYAAGMLSTRARERLAEIDRRIEKLDEWKPKPWQWLAPPYVLARKYLNEREKAKLKAERRELERVLRSLESIQERNRVDLQTILNTKVLPPPPAQPPDSEPHEHADSHSHAAQSATPAASVSGQPVTWGR